MGTDNCGVNVLIHDEQAFLAWYAEHPIAGAGVADAPQSGQVGAPPSPPSDDDGLDWGIDVGGDEADDTDDTGGAGDDADAGATPPASAPDEDERPAEGEQRGDDGQSGEEQGQPSAFRLSDDLADQLLASESARKQLLEHPQMRAEIEALQRQQAEEAQRLARLAPENDEVWVAAARNGAAALRAFEENLAKFGSGELTDPAVLSESFRSFGHHLAIATREQMMHAAHMAFLDEIEQLTNGQAVPDAVQRRYEESLRAFHEMNQDSDPRKAQLAWPMLQREWLAIRAEIERPRAMSEGAEKERRRIEAERPELEANIRRQLEAAGVSQTLGRGTPQLGAQPQGGNPLDDLDDLSDAEYERRLPEILRAQAQALRGR